MLVMMSLYLLYNVLVDVTLEIVIDQNFHQLLFQVLVLIL